MGNLTPAPTPAPQVEDRVFLPPSPNPIGPPCSEAEFDVCQFPSNKRRGVHCGLTFEIFGSLASSQNTALGTCMTNTKYGFRADWTPVDGNYLARKGVRPGTRHEIITYDANFDPVESFLGFSLLGAYGWLQNPLIEYYVVEDFGGLKPPVGLRDYLGELESDGGIYDIYTSERVNKPSIEGIRTFTQWWSVRRTTRTKGSITMNNHFCAWEKAGLDMGSFFEVSLVAEGAVAFGTADVALDVVTVPPEVCPTEEPTPSPTAGPTGGPTLGAPTPSPVGDNVCNEGTLGVCQFPSATRTGTHCGLEYEVFGSVAAATPEPSNIFDGTTCMDNTNYGFRAEWEPDEGTYLARKGIRPGNRYANVTFGGTFEPIAEATADGGFSLVGAYGWLQNPLIEYYVVENWAGARPPPGGDNRVLLGDYDTDGGVYDVYSVARENVLSIEGIRNFTQFWSVRQTPRASGSLTMNDHFCAWERVGLEIGSLYEVSFTAKGSNSSGIAEVALAIDVLEPGECPTEGPTAGPTTGPTIGPTLAPTNATEAPSASYFPSSVPTATPTEGPTAGPTFEVVLLEEDFSAATPETPVVLSANTEASNQNIRVELTAPPASDAFLITEEPQQRRRLQDLSDMLCPPSNGAPIELGDDGTVSLMLPGDQDSQILFCSEDNEFLGAFFSQVVVPGVIGVDPITPRTSGFSANDDATPSVVAGSAATTSDSAGECAENILLMKTTPETAVPFANAPLEIARFLEEDATVELDLTDPMPGAQYVYVSYSGPYHTPKCVGFDDFAEDLGSITAHCLITSPVTLVSVYVVDPSLDSDRDASSIPRCCQFPEEDEGLPTIRYSFQVFCESQCEQDVVS